MAAVELRGTDQQAFSTLMAVHTQPVIILDGFSMDAVLDWFRGEFAAANAIIDALCGHLVHVGEESGTDYEAVFAAVHRRRLNWIPVLHMQTYHSISDVLSALSCVVQATPARCDPIDTDQDFGTEIDDGDVADEFQEEWPPFNESICSNHEDCIARSAHIKLKKGFISKEQVKGHVVNVVKGLKLYEDVFTDSELSRLIRLVDELRTAGQNGELTGETFILFNKEIKGNKKEMIQLGIPIFADIKDQANCNNQRSEIEAIPALVQNVIDHLIQWHLLPENKRPNGCVVNFFDEGEYSQPFLKPPHLDEPVAILLLHESTMAFGQALGNYNDGNYRSQLMLLLKQGSLLVMRGNSIEIAGHAMCPCPNRRASITFFHVAAHDSRSSSSTTTVSDSDTVPTTTTCRESAVPSPDPVLPKTTRRGGTGVFLPWILGPKKHAQRLPPRALNARLLSLW